MPAVKLTGRIATDCCWSGCDRPPSFRQLSIALLDLDAICMTDCYISILHSLTSSPTTELDSTINCGPFSLSMSSFQFARWHTQQLIHQDWPSFQIQDPTRARLRLVNGLCSLLRFSAIHEDLAKARKEKSDRTRKVHLLSLLHYMKMELKFEVRSLPSVARHLRYFDEMSRHLEDFVTHHERRLTLSLPKSELQWAKELSFSALIERRKYREAEISWLQKHHSQPKRSTKTRSSKEATKILKQEGQLRMD